jgi:small subunit ribosomal protein S4
MIRKRKMFARPKKAYEKTRITEENVLVEKYGLKNKKEIWKTIAKIKYYRQRAKDLAKRPEEEQKVLFDKLNEIGLEVKSISDVLALNVEMLLKRRLPTIVMEKNLAKTIKEARQMVVHRQVSINGQVVNIPSYIVRVAEEKGVTGTPRKMVDKKNEKSGDVENG